MPADDQPPPAPPTNHPPTVPSVKQRQPPIAQKKDPPTLPSGQHQSPVAHHPPPISTSSCRPVSNNIIGPREANDSNAATVKSESDKSFNMSERLIIREISKSPETKRYFEVLSVTAMIKNDYPGFTLMERFVGPPPFATSDKKDLSFLAFRDASPRPSGQKEVILFWKKDEKTIVLESMGSEQFKALRFDRNETGPFIPSSLLSRFNQKTDDNSTFINIDEETELQPEALSRLTTSSTILSCAALGTSSSVVGGYCHYSDNKKKNDDPPSTTTTAVVSAQSSGTSSSSGAGGSYHHKKKNDAPPSTTAAVAPTTNGGDETQHETDISKSQLSKEFKFVEKLVALKDQPDECPLLAWTVGGKERTVVTFHYPEENRDIPASILRQEYLYVELKEFFPNILYRYEMIGVLTPKLALVSLCTYQIID